MSVRPICDAVRDRGVEAILEYSARFDGVAPDRHRGARARPWPAALADARPRRPRRSRGVDPPAARHLRGRAGARRRHRRSARAHASPTGWCRSTGSASTSPAAWRRWSRACVMNVVPAQVAGRPRRSRWPAPPQKEQRRPARTRRSWPRARCSASTRSTPSAAPRRSRCSPTAPARAAGSTWSPGPATSTPSRPSGCSRARSASTPRPGRPRSRSWPTTPPTPAYVAADLISQAEHDPLAASVLVTDSRGAGRRRRGRARQAGLRDPAHRADPHRAGRPAVGHRPGRRRRAGARRRQRLRRRAPRDPDRDARRGRGPGAQRRRDLRRARSRRSRWATTAPAPTTCCRPAGCACHSSGLSVRAFLQVGARRRLLARRAGRGRRPRGHPGRGRGPARATAPRSRAVRRCRSAR